MRKLIYALLIFCLLFFIYADLKLSNVNIGGVLIFQRYGNGLVTNIFSALITFTIIDNLLSYYENIKSKTYRSLAYQQLLKSFWKLGEMFTNMVKVSLAELPEETTKDIPSTLRANFALNIERLEFNNRAPVIPDQLWYRHAYGLVSNRYKEIHKTLDTYLPYIDTELINKILELENNTLIVNILNAPLMIETNEYGYTQFPMYIGSNEHTKKGLDLMADIFEELRKESDLKLYHGLTVDFWNPNYGAILGSARVDDLQAQGVFGGIQV